MGKTTVGRLLADHYGISFLHSSEIIKSALPGDWYRKGRMAPEPEATLLITGIVARYQEQGRGFILDGYPRSAGQIAGARRTSIVYLHAPFLTCLQRRVVADDGRFDPTIEESRIREQTALLKPVRAVAAVEVPTRWRTAIEVRDAIVDWLEFEKQPVPIVAPRHQYLEDLRNG